MVVTPNIDGPALAAAMRRLGWAPEDLAAAAGLPVERARVIAAGGGASLADARAIQLAVVTATLARQGA